MKQKFVCDICGEPTTIKIISLWEEEGKGSFRENGETGHVCPIHGHRQNPAVVTTADWWDDLSFPQPLPELPGYEIRQQYNDQPPELYDEWGNFIGFFPHKKPENLIKAAEVIVDRYEE